MAEPLRPYDQAAYEWFCSDLDHLKFRPRPDTERRRWTGPTPASLTPLTTSQTIDIVFYDGWPHRYAHVHVPKLNAEHVANGIVCLWAEDDPAQLSGSTVAGLMRRLDEWAASAISAFGPADQALDPHIAFAGFGTARCWAEIDLPTALGTATNGYIGTIHGHVRNRSLRLTSDPKDNPLTGPVYLRTGTITPPRNLDEFRALLTRRQRHNLDTGLTARTDTGQNNPSGGHDHAVLVWPRHGTKDALVLSFSGTGETLQAHPNAASPTDQASRLRRAGPDAPLIAGKRVLLAGAGSIGGQVALTLANSGMTRLTLRDDDDLKTANLVRHVLPEHYVGYDKSIGIKLRIEDSAPWCQVQAAPDLSYDPHQLAGQIRGHQLIIDCTGLSPLTNALAHVAAAEGIPLLTGALHHRGSILRIRRQTPTDTPLGQRAANPEYVQLPPDTADPGQTGFLELGCTAPVHNAPPASVLRAAADIAAAALDLLTGRNQLPDEIITVLTPLAGHPFDTLGPVVP